jgi:hypothetical protein
MRPRREPASIICQKYLVIIAALGLVLAESASGRAQPHWPSEPLATSVPVAPAQVTPLEWPLSARHHIPTPFAETGKLDLNSLFPELQTLQEISFRDFIRQVEEANLDLAAQRYNVPIAQMRVLAAHVYPNPVIQGLYAVNISHQQQPTVMRRP